MTSVRREPMRRRAATWLASPRAHLPAARSVALTVAAGAALWVALTLPSAMTILLNRPWYLQLPLAAVVLVALAAIVPRRPLRIVALVAGALIGVLVVIKALNIGFHAVFDRGFDIVGDWYYLEPGVGVLDDTTGRAWTIVIVSMTFLLVGAILVAMPLAAARLASTLGRRRRATAIAAAILLAVWAGGAATGAAVGRGTPLASADTSQLAWSTVRQVPRSITDRAAFSTEINADPYRDATPSLSGLRGKDVLLVFLESIGEVALTDPRLAPTVDAAFANGQQQLAAAGVSAESGWLTSPTFGGASWLAHSTVESGLWVDSQRRYNQLMSTQRLTLAGAFGQAGWRTVFDVPATTRAWPEGQPFYHFDKLYTANNVGYHGPTYGYATMPDQYIFAALDRLELARTDRRPLMAEVDLLSSHYPWTEPPPIVPWDSVGDGSGFPPPSDGSAGASAGTANIGTDGAAASDDQQIYANAVAYVIRTLASFAATSNDPNLVILAMGDHQPKTSISGPNASHTVPAMLIARDPAVTSRIAGWNWTPGLRPAPDAPNWPMNDLRDRIFSAFGPASGGR